MINQCDAGTVGGVQLRRRSQLGTEKGGTLLSFFVDSANLRDLEIHFENSIKTLEAHRLRHP